MKPRILLITLFLFLLVGTNINAQSYVDYFNQAQSAYEKGENQIFLQNMIKADSLRPNHRVILFNLARAYSVNAKNAEAFDVLEKLASFYASAAILDSASFASLTDEDRWQLLKRTINQANKKIESSELAFQFTKAGLHLESIEYDPLDEVFYLTDIHSGIIYRTDSRGGTLEEFLDLKEYGYWSPMVVKKDTHTPHYLWVLSSALNVFSDYDNDMEGKSALLLFDVRSGKIVKEYLPKEDGHSMGDFVISSKGELFITDSQLPKIYKLDKVKGSIEEAFSTPDWWSLQGIVSTADGSKLYVSDYLTGIYVVDLREKKVSALITDNYKLRSTDGLYLKSDKLIAIQNGTFPKRIAVISLNEEGSGISSSLKFVDQSREELEEPTLGTWVRGDLYYIANSPWGYYDEGMNPKLEEWPAVIVMRLKGIDIK